MLRKKVLGFVGVFMCCALFFSPDTFASGDEIRLLKSQIEALEATVGELKAKVSELEAGQIAQQAEIARVPELAETIGELKDKPVGFFENTRVGGHLKLYMFDRSEGNRNGSSQHNSLSAGLHHLYLYFTKELSSWLGVHVETDTAVTAAATPTLGADLSRASSSSVSTDLHKAYLTLSLPKGFEVKAGLMYPLFSEDYAKETWWDQMYHLNRGQSYLQSWQDSGIELYKSFEFPSWSLPAYLYYLNGNTTNSGGDLVDNNDAKTVLLHVAPEFFGSRLRLLGSLAFGRWDGKSRHDMRRYAMGAEVNYRKWTFLGEYLSSKWENLDLAGGGTEDGSREGYYFRASYRFNPQWRALINFSHAELYNAASTTMRTDEYDEILFGLNYFITDSSTIIAQFLLGEADRSDSSDSLRYRRFTLGWRTTF